MRLRCYSSKDNDYVNYGGRGILIEDSWLTFENFYKDMEPKFKSGLTLERLNNNLGYSKNNCIWATRKEQNNNRRIRKTNKQGIPGIYWYKEIHYQVYFDHPGNRIYLGSTSDFFEACCLRKSYESKLNEHSNLL